MDGNLHCGDWSVMRGDGPAAVARLPDGPGVYRFRDERCRVLYAGRASSPPSWLSRLPERAAALLPPAA